MVRGRQCRTPTAYISGYGMANGYNGLAKNHPFIDGNKRTAFAVMATFLEVNGYSLDVPEMDVVVMMEGLATNRETQDSMAKWLEENSVPYF
jgi:death-on-curing protein